MKIRRIFALLFVLFAAFSNAEAHLYHISIAEIKYNAKTQSLEIALKVFTDDLEKTLSFAAQKPVTLQQTAEVKKQLETYLKKNLRLENAAKQTYQQRFLGFETEADAQWLFLEIAVKPDELKQAKLRNQVLLETYPDQMNLTNLEINGKKHTLIFKEGDVSKTLL
ncbi:DUF6702 family protein [Adhaeribacter terreus]|uniref:DUF6702 family protein n=1 Tax=Adhaeribacter terreus TaxID=529703 RepID=A0ABW0EIF0_9BACT